MAPRILLAGFNVDADMLGRYDQHEVATPETISAAYARISRSSDPVDVLRSKAAKDVAKARKSNETIVFEYAHHSVAEHAVFNFDIIGVSRLAIEAIEHSRIGVGFTEKSQRYVTFKGDEEVVVPDEIEDAGYGPQFRDFVRETHEQYHFLLEQIKDQERPQGGNPQEDARYVTSLAVVGQLGMTVNARSLELMVRRLCGHPLDEVRQVGRELHRLAKQVAPSLIRYCEPEPLRSQSHDLLRALMSLSIRGDTVDIRPVSLLTAPGSEGEGDLFLLASLVHQVSQAPYALCHAAVSTLSVEQRFGWFRQLFSLMEKHDAAPRVWEMASLNFELCCSACCFAQLKRHRMATILPQPYDPSLGLVMPESIQKNEVAKERFAAVVRTASAFYRKLSQKVNHHVAEYVLTQAHRRRVLVSMNARELYAFSRLREDAHAQWEIRNMAQVMVSMAREVMPLSMALACGKDRFEEVKSKLFSVGGSNSLDNA